MSCYFFSSKDLEENDFCFDHVTTDMHSEKVPQSPAGCLFESSPTWLFLSFVLFLKVEEWHLDIKAAGGELCVCVFLGLSKRKCAEGLQEPARQIEVKLGNLGWLSSTSALEVGRLEDAAERALG